jgi:F420H(2)-dependent quinone reductase
MPSFPNSRRLLAWITRIHRWLYLRSGGRIGGRASGFRFLLLWHIGRKSGRRRAAPLLYIEDAGRFVVVASNAGDPSNPGWWLNLRAQPDTEVQVGSERVVVRAYAANGAERERLWAKLVAANPQYPEYQRRTQRPIPIVVLERTT